ncbi:hypothetical protein D3C80_1390490 [compost metagenome]
MQHAGIGQLDLFGLHEHRVAAGQPVVHGVLGAFACARGAASEAVDQDVLVRVVLDAGIVVGHAFHQVPEVMQTLARFGRRIHADHRGPQGA